MENKNVLRGIFIGLFFFGGFVGGYYQTQATANAMEERLTTKIEDAAIAIAMSNVTTRIPDAEDIARKVDRHLSSTISLAVEELNRNSGFQLDQSDIRMALNNCWLTLKGDPDGPFGISGKLDCR